MKVTLSTSGGTQDLSGTVTVTAVPVPSGQVQSVQFYVDDLLVGAPDTSPYTYSWDTAAVVAGPHQLRAVVRFSRYLVSAKTLDVTVVDQTEPEPPLPPPDAPIQDVPVLVPEDS